jgi:hypothetical protein
MKTLNTQFILWLVLFAGCAPKTQIKSDNSGKLINNEGSNPQRAEAQDFNTTRSNRERNHLKTSGAKTDTTKTPQPAQAQDFNTTRSNRERNHFKTSGAETDTTKAPQPAQAQDFNTTRSNRERNHFKTSGAETDTTKAPQPAQAQDFNTTRSNRERNHLKTSGAETDTTQAPQPAQAQDFNTTRSNRERNHFKTSGVGNSTDYFELSFNPSIDFPIANKSKNNLYTQAAYGSAVELRYFKSNIGFSLSSGFSFAQIDQQAIDQEIKDLGFTRAYTTSANPAVNSFLMLGAAYRWEGRVRFSTTLQSGILLGKSANVSANANGTELLTLSNTQKAIQPTIKGGVALGLPLSNNWAIDLHTAYQYSPKQIRYYDFNSNATVDRKINAQNISSSISLVYRIKSYQNK